MVDFGEQIHTAINMSWDKILKQKLLLRFQVFFFGGLQENKSKYVTGQSISQSENWTAQKYNMYMNKLNSILEASLQEFFQLLFLTNAFERWTFDTISKMNL